MDPLALADLHRDTPVDAEVHLSFPAEWPGIRVTDVVVGGGFEPVSVADAVRARRVRTLPDTVGPGMRLLVCGLNPSLHAADAGVGFVTPGNRFWLAAISAGIVSCDRDPRHALVEHGIGMTDLVKRATSRAADLTRAEYHGGLERIVRVCGWLRPAAVCFVGLAGWRAAADRKAVAGWQPTRLGDTPVYVMPSTSGLNAATSLDELTEHLRTASQPT